MYKRMQHKEKIIMIDVRMDLFFVTDLEHELAFSNEITFTAFCPDMIIWAVNLRKVFIV